MQKYTKLTQNVEGHKTNIQRKGRLFLVQHGSLLHEMIMRIDVIHYFKESQLGMYPCHKCSFVPFKLVVIVGKQSFKHVNSAIKYEKII